jgi:acetylornithine deacetylase/succinyl-diaminopimelate desuccinylase-like protein
MRNESVHAFIDAHLNEHIRAIQELVQQPSVSLEEDGTIACADLVLQRLIQLGCQDTARLDVGDAYPGVWGWLDVGAAKTILYYSHYDVRPTGHEKWTNPPFDAVLVEQAPYPRVLMGRGALVAKGPLQAWLNALSSIRNVTGTLPVNVMFLIEGAEILGSPNYLRLVRAASRH